MTRHGRTIRVAALLLAALLPPRAAVATTQYPPTVIRHTAEGWQLKDDHVGGHGLLVIGQDGTERPRLPLESLIHKDDILRFVDRTTAGPRWGEHALSYFVTIDDMTLWGCTTWWGRRILIDLETAQPTAPDKLNDTLRTAEERCAMGLLKDGPLILRNTDWKHTERLLSAVHYAGRERLQEAVPLLQDMERLDSRLRLQRALSDHQVYEVRRMSQWALRRLGKIPAGYPATRMRDIAVDPDKPIENRGSRVSDIEKGMMLQRVVELLGPPDYADNGWRYDIDAHEPYSLLIVWSHLKQVETADRITPPLWRMEDIDTSTSGRYGFTADGSFLVEIRRWVDPGGRYKIKAERLKGF